jgi:hypothetical protein
MGLRRGVLRLFFFIVSLQVITGCYLVSDNLVGGEEAIITDSGLPGLWKSPGKPGFFMIVGHKNDMLSFFFFEQDFTADAEYYAGYATRTKGETFLNIRRYKAAGEPPADQGYIPAYYKLDGDKLTIALFDTDPVDVAIQAKKIAGVASVKKSAYSSTPTRLTAPGKDVSAFLRTHLKTPGALEKALHFERIEMPALAR